MATAGNTHDIVLGTLGFNLANKEKNYIVATTTPTRNAYLAENEVMAGTPPAAVDGTDGHLTPTHRLYFDKWHSLGAFHYSRENAQKGRVLHLDRMRPIAEGEALSPLPQERVYDDTTVSTANFFGAFQLGSNVYLWRDAQIYLLQTSGGLFSGYTSAGMPAALANNIIDAHVAFGNVYLATGTNSYSWNGSGAPAALGIAREYWVHHYDTDVWSNNQSLKWAFNSNNFNLELGAHINSIIIAYGAVWVGTDDGIWRFQATRKAGNPSSAPSTLNLLEPTVDKVVNFNFSQTSSAPQTRNAYGMKAFGGYLWFWANGQVYRAKPDTSLDVEAQPVRGDLRGMNICDGLLVACVSSPYNTQIFAWQPDPEGWFRLGGQDVSVYRYYSAPFSALPIAQDGAVMAFCAGKQAIVSFPLDNRYISRNNPNNYGLSTINVTGTVALPLITPQDLAEQAGISQKRIAWVRPLRIGVEWSVLVRDSQSFGEWANLDSYVNQYKFTADVSMDNGKTWASLFSAFGQGQYFPQTGEGYNGKASFNIQRSAPTGLEYDIRPSARAGQPAGLTNPADRPHGWMFRIKHTGSYGPAVRRIWLDYEYIMTAPHTGRQWTLLLDLLNNPGYLQLDSQPDTQQPSKTPADYAAHFFALWQTGELLDFVDLVGHIYHVKVTHVEAIRTAAGYRPTLGGGLKPEFIVKIVLTEVFIDPIVGDNGGGGEIIIQN